MSRLLYTSGMTQPEEVVEVEMLVEIEATIALPGPADRCDSSCNQSAVAAVVVGDGPLLFCGHHWRKNAAALKSGGYEYAVKDGEDVGFTG